MSDLERELRSALRREEPSPEFRARVMARVEERAPWWKFSWGQMRWAAAVTLAVAVVVGVPMYREVEQRRRAEGEEARQQVVTALRIAGSKVRLAQVKVQQLSQR